MSYQDFQTNTNFKSKQHFSSPGSEIFGGAGGGGAFGKHVHLDVPLFCHFPLLPYHPGIRVRLGPNRT